MNAVTTASNAAQALDVHAAGSVQAAGIFDWVETMSAQVTTTAGVVIVALAVVFAIVIIVRGKFSIASIVMAVLVAGAGIYVVVEGVSKSRDMIGETVDASVVQELAPGEHLPADAPALPEGLALL